jgi:hypothetical protein
MKLSEINNIINNVISEEIRKTIILESSSKEVYHIKCEGEPIATFETEKEAEEALPDYKAKSTGELIIEKGVYDSHEDMLDKLDEMGEELEEKENKNMKKQEPIEGNEFTGALKAAKDAGEEKFTVDGKEYDVNEINEDDYESQEDDSFGPDFDKLPEDDMNESSEMCEQCGGEMTEGVCNECSGGMKNESKKKVLRLKESEMLLMISRIVKESVPGLEVTKRAQTQSKKDNETHATEVAKKIKGATTFDGNDNPEFPKQIGKGEKVARKNTPEQEEEIEDNRGGGLEDLSYDAEPSQQFKDRVKNSLEGHTSTGNSQDYANVVKSDLGKNIAKKVERKQEARKNMVMYKKDVQPTKAVNESIGGLENLLLEEIEKMKKIANYDKKTQ